MWPCIVTNFFIIKPTRCTNFTNLFWHETVHVSDSSSVHHQEFIHCTLSNGVSYRRTWSCSKAVYKPVWHIPLLSVQWINSWWWTEELPETCRFSCQNKFVKLMHLFGFITKKLNGSKQTDKPGWNSRYSYSIWAARSRDRIPARIFHSFGPNLPPIKWVLGHNFRGEVAGDWCLLSIST
jgi:hypothetical protein